MVSPLATIPETGDAADLDILARARTAVVLHRTDRNTVAPAARDVRAVDRHATGAAQRDAVAPFAAAPQVPIAVADDFATGDAHVGDVLQQQHIRALDSVRNRMEARAARHAQVHATAQQHAALQGGVAQCIDHVIARPHIDDAAATQSVDRLLERARVVAALVAPRAERAHVHDALRAGQDRGACQQGDTACHARHHGPARPSRADGVVRGVPALAHAPAGPKGTWGDCSSRPISHGSNTASR
jgi:hypothetical protein